MLRRLFKTFYQTETFTKIIISGSVLSFVGIIAPVVIYKLQTFEYPYDIISFVHVAIACMCGSTFIFLSLMNGWDMAVNDIRDTYEYIISKESLMVENKTALPETYGRNFLTTKITNARIYFKLMKKMSKMTRNYLHEIEENGTLGEFYDERRE